MSKRVFLCSICNISSGNCSEDCKFCTQSVYHNTQIEKYKTKPTEEIIEEAKTAKKNGAYGFCLVTSGVGLDKKKREYVAQNAKVVKAEVSGLKLIGCNGLASVEDLQYLKDNGIDNYNHNLETEKDFYETICTTHDWEERFQTCKNVKEVGLKLVSGGIFGMGESEDERKKFFDQLALLQPDTIPLNFFHPNAELALTQDKIDPDEALKVIEYARSIFPEKRIMVAGGREVTFKERWLEIFDAGANAIVIGNYLTTKGEVISKDKEELEKAGFILG
ncbi:MAG: biotin synthase [Campylobacterales bacterium]|nr:biotin synthase [Campylobacterales bacterium]